MNDTDLRTALQELGDVPPPPDLAGSALARARRDRRRTLIGLVAGVAVLAALAVTVPALVLGQPAPPQTAVATAPSAVVTGYAAWNPATGAIEYWTYDRSSGRYITTPWRTAVPSPDGRQVLVTEWNAQKHDRIGLVAADRVLERTAVRWISDGRPHPGRVPPGIGPGVWSPDSSRVLLTAYTTNAGAGANRPVWHVDVVDARTLAAREVVLRTPAGRIKSTFGTVQVVFGPRGNGFAALSTGVMSLFDEQGRPAGQLPAEEVHDQPFSPDGSLLAASFVVDAGSRVLGVPGGAEVGRVDGKVVGWLDDRHCMVLAGGTARAVELGSGSVLAERQLVPAGRSLVGAWTVPLDGAVPPGAVVL
ncbi:MAG TPA: hypothetical protein VI357_10300 [Mycobacteriales bacterium]